MAIQYIRQLIEDPRAYRRILAVTFTNKATTEMKERILEQLLGIARGLKGSEGYLQELVKLTGKSVEDIRKGAQEALFFILHDYSRFRIETIDSFFQSVMRNLARELELGANLSIELNNTEVLSDAVDVMLEKLDRKSPVLYCWNTSRNGFRTTSAGMYRTTSRVSDGTSSTRSMWNGARS